MGVGTTKKRFAMQMLSGSEMLPPAPVNVNVSWRQSCAGAATLQRWTVLTGRVQSSSHLTLTLTPTLDLHNPSTFLEIHHVFYCRMMLAGGRGLH